MTEYQGKATELKRAAASDEVTQRKGKAANHLVDNRPGTVAQKKILEAVGSSRRVQQLKTYQPGTDKTLQLKEHTTEDPSPAKVEPIQAKTNNTGLPDNLKSGIENLSGHTMHDVKVYYNSAKPAQLQALAYAQGTDIHVGPGQEKHLPHEAWHVVQQKQGRVRPTIQMKQGAGINDNRQLENEADAMGAKAIAETPEGFGSTAGSSVSVPGPLPVQGAVIQRVLTPLPGKSSGILRGKRDKINALIVKYAAATGNAKKAELLGKISHMTLLWDFETRQKQTKLNEKSDTKHSEKLIAEADKLTTKLGQIDRLLTEIAAERVLYEDDVPVAASSSVMPGSSIASSSSMVPSSSTEPVLGEREEKKKPSPVDQHPEEIMTIAEKNGYHASTGPFWQKQGESNGLHVGWKAHIGATAETAAMVFSHAIPIMDGFKLTNKVDTSLTVFSRTNKFITIYPPADEGAWAPFIAEMEAAVGPNLVQVKGELPVGKTGGIGMRHGQITGLSLAMLDSEHIRYSVVGGAFKLTEKAQYDPKIRDGELVINNRVLFGYFEGNDGPYPAIIYRGIVMLDPRSEPNPFKHQLPDGVTEYGKTE